MVGALTSSLKNSKGAVKQSRCELATVATSAQYAETCTLLALREMHPNKKKQKQIKAL